MACRIIDLIERVASQLPNWSASLSRRKEWLRKVVNSILFVKKENGSSDNARGKVEMTSLVALESYEHKGHT